MWHFRLSTLTQRARERSCLIANEPVGVRVPLLNRAVSVCRPGRELCLSVYPFHAPSTGGTSSGNSASTSVYPCFHCLATYQPTDLASYSTLRPLDPGSDVTLIVTSRGWSGRCSRVREDTQHHRSYNGIRISLFPFSSSLRAVFLRRSHTIFPTSFVHFCFIRLTVS